MSAPTEGQDQFKPLVNHRAGYGTVDERLTWLLEWLTRHPDATLMSGEGALLVQHIRSLQDRITQLEQERR